MQTLQKSGRVYQKGQITIMVVMALAIFMLAFAGLATDYASFWFTRQSVQGAADATCQAAAVDLYTWALGANGPSLGMGFTPGTAFSCSVSGKPNAAPCKIAKLNGFDGTLASNSINVSFPAAVSGVTGPPGVTFPFIQADVTNHAPTYFSKLLTGRSTVDVHASAVCGLTNTQGPVPIIVLHPTDPQAIEMKGSKDAITVVGGPPQSIQVNSSHQPSAVRLEAINLSQGGPSYSGGQFGVYGGPAMAPGSVNMGTTGSWLYPHLPISDPYRLVDAPSQPAVLGTSKSNVPKGTDGCPGGKKGTCTEYYPGYWPGGIAVKNDTGLFVPGIYYLGGQGLQLQANSIVRVACGSGPNCAGLMYDTGIGGVMFYFSGTATLSIDANSGRSGLADLYHRDGGTFNNVANRALQCPGGSANPPQIPATIDGNMLVAPCSGTYGDPTGKFRGFLFFQDRDAAASPQWQGGGDSISAGYMYFHQCKSTDGAGKGTNCSAPDTGYGTTFNLGGNPGSASFTIGSIVTDRIASNGNPGIQMILTPDKIFPFIKIGIFK